MKKKLTAVAVATLPPGNYTDAACAGLTLRVGVKRRTWSVFHRLGGRLRQTTIGHFPHDGPGRRQEGRRRRSPSASRPAPRPSRPPLIRAPPCSRWAI